MALQETTVRAAPLAPRRSIRLRPRSVPWKSMVVLLVLIGFWYLEASRYSHRGLSFLVPYPHATDDHQDPS